MYPVPGKIGALLADAAVSETETPKGRALRTYVFAILTSPVLGFQATGYDEPPGILITRVTMRVLKTHKCK